MSFLLVAYRHIRGDVRICKIFNTSGSHVQLQLVESARAKRARDVRSVVRALVASIYPGVSDTSRIVGDDVGPKLDAGAERLLPAVSRNHGNYVSLSLAPSYSPPSVSFSLRIYLRLAFSLPRLFFLTQTLSSPLSPLALRRHLRLPPLCPLYTPLCYKHPETSTSSPPTQAASSHHHLLSSFRLQLSYHLARAYPHPLPPSA